MYQNRRNNILDIFVVIMVLLVIVGTIVINYTLDFAYQRSEKSIESHYTKYEDIPDTLLYVDAEFSIAVSKTKKYNFYIALMVVMVLIAYSLRVK